MDTGGIIEILKCVVPPLWRYVQYYRKLHENMRILERKLEELKSRKEDIELSLKTECSLGKLPKSEVNNWLQNTQRIYTEVQNIEHKVKEAKYFSRARLGKCVEKKIQEVKEHYECSSFESLVIDAPPFSGLLLPTTTLVGETTAKKNVDEIWEYLMGNEVMKIGVCGMGGAGKTTIVTHIHNKLIDEANTFMNVLWVTVSQPLDVMKLQDQIASALKESLSGIDDKKIRAGEVLQILKGKKFVMILDDMWEPFRLDEVGIPEPTKSNGSKLVITTRSLDVCRAMGCKEFNVKLLPEDEALKLFLDQVGNDIITRSPTLEDIVKLVVKQCVGLPLAIVTVAGCMKGEEEICEWRNALAELSQNIKNVKGMETKIPGQLQFSYDRLKDEKIKHCFLYCALYPEDFKIPKKELISYWIAEGLVDERGSIQATYDKGHSILNRLVNNCLLQSGDDGGKSVKMHDLIRDMALEITSRSPLFMIQSGIQLLEFPREEEWKGNLEKVSLMRNGISEFPSNLSPNCQTLSTLLLQRNPLRYINSEYFFVHMPKLRILDLSYTLIKDLLNSISELRYLTTLLLNYCVQLQHVPTLAKLSSLWKLELRATMINEVPDGIEKLEKLRYLDLRKLFGLPSGILCKLSRLQKLSIFIGSETSQPIIEEITKLRELEIFEGHFRKIKDFNHYVKCLDSQSPTPQNYRLLLGSSVCASEDVEYVNVTKHVELWDCKICGEDSVHVLEEVQRLQIGLCKNLISLNDVLLFNRLDKEGGRSGKCSDLKVLEIRYCHGLKRLFSPKLLQALQNLEVIDVDSCDEIEEIITLDIDEEENHRKEGSSDTIIFTFPKLRKMTLRWLRKLKSICSGNGVMVCDSLQQIEVYECRKLKRLPLSLPLHAIKEIMVQRNWWESLECDNPNAKSDLEPYCRWL